MPQELVVVNEKFEITTVSVGRGFFVAMKPQVRKAVFVFLKSVWNGYYKIQFYNEKHPYQVGLPIDAQIPFTPNVLKDYYSFIPAWIALFSFLNTEFGEVVTSDIQKFIFDLSKLYTESGKVYREAQTSYKRTGSAGFKIGLLRFIDKEKNFAPSLHVEVAAFTYIRGVTLLEKYGGKSSYLETKQYLLERCIKIIESTLLIKQHCVRDIALGLFMVSGMEAKFTLTEAEKVVEELFEKRYYGMNEEFIKKIRLEIRNVYAQVLSDWETQGHPSPALPVIKYIQSL
jgi:hypothetical protein